MTDNHANAVGHDTTGDRAEEAYTAAARLLATQPGSIQRALAAHRRTPDGRCSSCGTTSRWPCAVVAIAHRAARLTNNS